MSSNVKVEEATTQKKPYKFGYLNELITDEVEYKKAHELLNKMDWSFSPLQNVNDTDGCYIQSILWLCDLADVWEQMEECGRADYNGGHEAKEIQAVVNHLNVLMVENDLDFIFI